jgi:predicted nucleic acid-binding protein
MGPRLSVHLLFDSNIIIDALNGYAEAAEEIRSATRRSTSIVCWIEVLAGCPTPEAERLARSLLEKFEVLDVDRPIAEQAMTIRRTLSLKLPDALVLATARALGVQLSTRNTKDFPAADPTIRVPYQL